MAGRRLTLLPGEQVLVDVRTHWSYLTGPLVASVVAVAVGITLDVALPHTSITLHWVEGVAVAVPCAWLAVRSLRWWGTGLTLTSVRLVERWGVVTVRRTEVPLSRIEQVLVVQSLARRLAGTGRLELVIRGEDLVHGIDDVRRPEVLQRIITRRLGPPSGILAR